MNVLARVLTLFFVCSFCLEARATWKPEYAKNPIPVQEWFKQAEVVGGYNKRLGIARCCTNAERLRTHFEGTPGKEWYYYPDPACIVKGCKLLPIPADVVHEDEIRALNPMDDRLPEFSEMRLEGVLFIYHGEPSCFWYPREGGG